MPVSIQPIAGSPSVGTTALRKAGQDFEALLLEKLLASANPRPSGPEADWRAMADRRLAADLAAASPLGVARMLETRR